MITENNQDIRTRTNQIEFIIDDEYTQAISDADILFFLAEMFQWPITAAKVEAQVGNFVLVDYTPYQNQDPDIIVMIAGRRVAFNKLMLRLQSLRATHKGDPRSWLRKGRRLFHEIQATLQVHNVPQHEQEFVLEWVQVVVAKMRTIKHPSIVV